MNNLQRLCAAVMFTFVLALPTYAGDMDCPAPAPPPSAPTTSEAVTRGDINTGPGVTTEGELFSEVVWGLVEGVLALL